MRLTEFTSIDRTWTTFIPVPYWEGVLTAKFCPSSKVYIVFTMALLLSVLIALIYTFSQPLKPLFFPPSLLSFISSFSSFLLLLFTFAICDSSTEGFSFSSPWPSQCRDCNFYISHGKVLLFYTVSWFLSCVTHNTIVVKRNRTYQMGFSRCCVFPGNGLMASNLQRLKIERG